MFRAGWLDKYLKILKLDWILLVENPAMRNPYITASIKCGPNPLIAELLRPGDP
jgi:hypothetical protein